VTTPVGFFPKSRQADFNLDDMAGNVGEWCDSLWQTRGDQRVVRGGSFAGVSRLGRAASRVDRPPSARLDYIGFRMVC